MTNAIARMIDAAVSVVSPARGLRRRFYRARLERFRSAMYAGAKTTRLTGAWSPVDANINTILGNSSATLRARVRQLVRDFPYFARAVNILVDYTVGSGIMFQSRVTTPDGKLDKKIISKIEDAFQFWADEADAEGRLHYYEMMRLAKRQDAETGEFMLVKTARSDRSRYVPFCLRMYETDWLSDAGAVPVPATNRVSNGVEYNPDTGTVAAYHFTDPDGWGKTIRIPAGNVIHKYETLRPGQLRGVSPFAPAILVAHDLNDYMDAEIDAAKMAAKYLAFVHTPDPITRQAVVETGDDDDTDNRIEEMENAILEYLRPGENVEIASNPRPGSNFTPFIKLVLTMVSVTVGVPYELLSGDYQGINYSTSRTSRNDFSQQLRPISARHVRHFGMETFRPFLDDAVLRGRIYLPGYWTNPYPYLATEWQPPGMESVDPLRETTARIKEVAAGLRSPQEIARARGRDLEEVYKEIARADELAAEMGIVPDYGKAVGLKTNPAEIMTKGLRKTAADKVVPLPGGRPGRAE